MKYDTDMIFRVSRWDGMRKPLWGHNYQQSSIIWNIMFRFEGDAKKHNTRFSKHNACVMPYLSFFRALPDSTPLSQWRQTLCTAACTGGLINMHKRLDGFGQTTDKNNWKLSRSQVFFIKKFPNASISFLISRDCTAKILPPKKGVVRLFSTSSSIWQLTLIRKWKTLIGIKANKYGSNTIFSNSWLFCSYLRTEEPYAQEHKMISIVSCIPKNNGILVQNTTFSFEQKLKFLQFTFSSQWKF